MATTEPIRKIHDIEQFKDYFLRKQKYRDYVLFVLGINTALRISDIISLKWNDVYDFQHKRYKSYIELIEKKTKKQTKIAINKSIIKALELFRSKCECRKIDYYVFQSRNGGNCSIGRIQAFNIIKKAASELGVEGKISCHSLRKTFGYHAWNKGVPPALLMSIYNHSSFEITKIYLGINQDDQDKVFINICL